MDAAIWTVWNLFVPWNNSRGEGFRNRKIRRAAYNGRMITHAIWSVVYEVTSLSREVDAARFFQSE